MPLVNFRLAVEGDLKDDADLRRLLRENALPGEIGLSYEREPSFWASGVMEGSLRQTMLVSAGGQTVGMGSRSVRKLYVNGEVQSVGYMSQMRVDPTYAWGMALPWALSAGWRYFRQLHQDGLTPYYLVSLIAGDNVAWRMMTLGLRDWPALHPVGGLLTYALSVRRARPLPHLPRGLTLRRGNADDGEAIADCLAANQRHRQFAPVWETADLGVAQISRVVPDLALSDFWVVEQGSRVVGTLARWNQRRFKQQVVAGYDARLLRMRPLVNAAAWLGLTPRLPAIGETVRLAFASHLAVDNDDPQLAAALLAAVYNDAVQAGDAFLMVGLDTEHPLTPLTRAYRRLVYATQLFLAAWGDEVGLARQVDGRQMGAEIALL